MDLVWREHVAQGPGSISLARSKEGIESRVAAHERHKYAPLMETAHKESSQATCVFFLPFVNTVAVDPVSMTSTVTIDVALHWAVTGIENHVTRVPTAQGEYYILNEGVVEKQGAEPVLSAALDFFFPNLKLDRTTTDEGRTPKVTEINVYRPQVGYTGPEDLHLYAYVRFAHVTVRHVFDLRRFPFDRECVTYFFMLEDQMTTEAILELHSPAHIFDCLSCFDDGVDAATDTSSVIGARLVPDHSTEEWSNVMRKHSMGTDEERFRWEQKTAPTYANMELRLDVKRESAYFLTKVVYVVMALMVMESATFLMEPSFADRSTVTLTLFLTAIAFQYAVAGLVPQLSYNTSLDSLVIFMYMLLFVSYAENVLVSTLVEGPLSLLSVPIPEGQLFLLFLLTIALYCGHFLISGFQHAAVPSRAFTELYTYTLDDCLPVSMACFDAREKAALQAQCTVFDEKQGK